MHTSLYYHSLSELYKQAKVISLKDKQKWIIFSDLHLGNGGSRDDFRKNSLLFQTILEKYYLHRDYSLILNGDIEELHKFKIESIYRQWQKLFFIFTHFQNKQKLFKIVGNHDRLLLALKEYPFREYLYRSIILKYKNKDLFLFHGDQASEYYMKYNHISGWLLQYIAYPLRINSKSAAYNSQKQYAVESRVYDFSREKKIVSIIGHTHRPLFESLSKVDFTKYQIEQLCRAYDQADKKKKVVIEKEIAQYRQEIEELGNKRKNRELSNYIYNSDLILPCVFNSGCVIGKRGITGIEISKGEIALVYWHDSRKKKKKYLHTSDYKSEKLEDTHYFRTVLKKDTLSYIFNRIELLS